jgi:hypothetical protein
MYNAYLYVIAQKFNVMAQILLLMVQSVNSKSRAFALYIHNIIHLQHTHASDISIFPSRKLFISNLYLLVYIGRDEWLGYMYHNINSEPYFLLSSLKLLLVTNLHINKGSNTILSCI